MNVTSCVSHERLALKPCLQSDKMLLTSRCSVTDFATMCSRSLQHTEVRLGHWSVVCSIMLVTLLEDRGDKCIFPWYGTLPCSSEAWKRDARG